jgi:hypothetical protein
MPGRTPELFDSAQIALSESATLIAPGVGRKEGSGGLTCRWQERIPKCPENLF